MRRYWPIIALALVSCGTPEERMAERALRLGVGFFNDGQFMPADSTFGTAPNDVRANYDQGSAAYRMKNWKDAIEQFSNAAQRDSSAQAPDARYNLGRTHLAEAMWADTIQRRRSEELSNLHVDAEEIAEKVDQFVTRDSLQIEVRQLDALIDSSLFAALEGFKSALRRDASDGEARFNLAYTQMLLSKRPGAGKGDKDGNKKDEDQKLSARAERIMKQADELVEQYKFKEALALMQKGLKEDPTLKAKKEYMDKLDVVTKAAQAS